MDTSQSNLLGTQRLLADLWKQYLLGDHVNAVKLGQLAHQIKLISAALTSYLASPLPGAVDLASDQHQTDHVKSAPSVSDVRVETATKTSGADHTDTEKSASAKPMSRGALLRREILGDGVEPPAITNLQTLTDVVDKIVDAHAVGRRPDDPRDDLAACTILLGEAMRALHPQRFAGAAGVVRTLDDSVIDGRPVSRLIGGAEPTPVASWDEVDRRLAEVAGSHGRATALILVSYADAMGHAIGAHRFADNTVAYFDLHAERGNRVSEVARPDLSLARASVVILDGDGHAVVPSSSAQDSHQRAMLDAVIDPAGDRRYGRGEPDARANRGVVSHNYDSDDDGGDDSSDFAFVVDSASDIESDSGDLEEISSLSASPEYQAALGQDNARVQWWLEGLANSNWEDVSQGAPVELGNVLDTEHWWHLYLNSDDHAAALRTSDGHPGDVYKAISGGFSRARIEAAYSSVLDNREVLEQPIDWSTYIAMHYSVTDAGGDTEFGGRENAAYRPVGASLLAHDMAGERVGGRLLVVNREAFDTIRDVAAHGIVAATKIGQQLALTPAYSSQELPDLVNAVFGQYYVDVKAATSEYERLRAIARLVRTIQVIRPLPDSHFWLDTHLLLPRVLLANGFRPVVLPATTYMFSGGFSLDHIATALRWGQNHDLTTSLDSSLDHVPLREPQGLLDQGGPAITPSGPNSTSDSPPSRDTPFDTVIDTNESVHWWLASMSAVEWKNVSQAGPVALSDLLPPQRWWRMYIDDRDHGAARLHDRSNPGGLYDSQRSAAFQADMQSAYQSILNDVDVLKRRVNWDEYLRMHQAVTAQTRQAAVGNKRFDVAGFPAKKGHYVALRQLADDLTETLDGRPLVTDAGSRPPGSLGEDGDVIAVAGPGLYGLLRLDILFDPERLPAMVNEAFERYYDAIGQARSEHERLRAIGQVVRTLSVMHPFRDGNGRLNINVLLPRLLLANGFQPVIVPSLMHLFNGGFSLDRIATALRWGQGRDLAVGLDDIQGREPWRHRILRLGFGRTSKALGVEHQTRIDNFAIEIVRDVARRHAEGRGGLELHIHGGGNGGRLSRGAEEVGIERASVIRDAVRAAVEPRLDALGIPRSMVRLRQPVSHKRAVLRDVFISDENQSDAQVRRTVVVRVEEAAEQRGAAGDVVEVEDGAGRPRGTGLSEKARGKQRAAPAGDGQDALERDPEPSSQVRGRNVHVQRSDEAGWLEQQDKEWLAKNPQTASNAHRYLDALVRAVGGNASVDRRTRWIDALLVRELRRGHLDVLEGVDNSAEVSRWANGVLAQLNIGRDGASGQVAHVHREGVAGPSTFPGSYHDVPQPTHLPEEFEVADPDIPAAESFPRNGLVAAWLNEVWRHIKPLSQNREWDVPRLSDEPWLEGTPLRLATVLPEQNWWRLFVDPDHHRAAIQHDGGSPGNVYGQEFREDYERVARDVLDNPSALSEPMNWELYRQLHEMGTRSVRDQAERDVDEAFESFGKNVEFRPYAVSGTGGVPTRFRPGANRMAWDVLARPDPEEFLTIPGESLENGEARTRPVVDSAPGANDGLVHYWRGGPPPTELQMVTRYSADHLPNFVQQIFDDYYQTLETYGAVLNNIQRLRLIAYVVRKLQVLHPFRDGNTRLNVQFLLPRLLLSAGFKPVVTPLMSRLFSGAFTVDQMSTALVLGQMQDPSEELTVADYLLEHSDPVPAPNYEFGILPRPSDAPPPFAESGESPPLYSGAESDSEEGVPSHQSSDTESFLEGVEFAGADLAVSDASSDRQTEATDDSDSDDEDMPWLTRDAGLTPERAAELSAVARWREGHGTRWLTSHDDAWLARHDAAWLAIHEVPSDRFLEALYRWTDGSRTDDEQIQWVDALLFRELVRTDLGPLRNRADFDEIYDWAGAVLDSDSEADDDQVLADLSDAVERVGSDDELVDCVDLLVGLRDEFHPAGVSSGVSASGVRADRTVDESAMVDSATAARLVDAGGWSRAAQARMAPGAVWVGIGDWGVAEAAAHAAGPGSTVFVLMSRLSGEGHAFALRHTSDGRLFWIDAQREAGQQLLAVSEWPSSSPESSLESAFATRILVVDADGRVRPDLVVTAPESGSTARAVIDAPTDSRYGSLRNGGDTSRGWTTADKADAPASNADNSVEAVSQPAHDTGAAPTTHDAPPAVASEAPDPSRSLPARFEDKLVLGGMDVMEKFASGNRTLANIEAFVRQQSGGEAAWENHKSQIEEMFSDDALRPEIPGLLRGGRPIIYVIHLESDAVLPSPSNRTLTIEFRVDGGHTDSRLRFKNTEKEYEFEGIADPSTTTASFGGRRDTSFLGIRGNLAQIRDRIADTPYFFRTWGNDSRLTGQRTDRQVSRHKTVEPATRFEGDLHTTTTYRIDGAQSHTDDVLYRMRVAVPSRDVVPTAVATSDSPAMRRVSTTRTLTGAAHVTNLSLMRDDDADGTHPSGSEAGQSQRQRITVEEFLASQPMLEAFVKAYGADSDLARSEVEQWLAVETLQANLPGMTNKQPMVYEFQGIPGARIEIHAFVEPLDTPSDTSALRQSPSAGRVENSPDTRPKKPILEVTGQTKKSEFHFGTETDIVQTRQVTHSIANQKPTPGRYRQHNWVEDDAGEADDPEDAALELWADGEDGAFEDGALELGSPELGPLQPGAVVTGLNGIRTDTQTEGDTDNRQYRSRISMKLPVRGQAANGQARLRFELHAPPSDGHQVQGAVHETRAQFSVLMEGPKPKPKSGNPETEPKSGNPQDQAEIQLQGRRGVGAPRTDLG